MHERKAMMADLADGFIAAPGGIGTMEELFETSAWSQLGLHEKPIGIYNVNNYYDCLIELVGHFAKEGFVREKYTESLVIENDPGTLLGRLRMAAAPKEKPAKAPGLFLI